MAKEESNGFGLTDQLYVNDMIQHFCLRESSVPSRDT